MENTKAIDFSFRGPVDDPDGWDRYLKWTTEVYVPLIMKLSLLRSYENYLAVKENPQYPLYGSILTFDSMEAIQSFDQTSEVRNIRKDLVDWTERGIVEYFWRARYESIYTLANRDYSKTRERSPGEDAQVIHIEAYSFSPEQEAKYEKWLTDFGYGVFLPVFGKIAGLREYSCYKFLNSIGTFERETKYPLYVSIIKFENLQAFENYTHSPELSVFQRALRKVFPRLPVFKWYVQYQLVKSWRK